MGRTRFSWLVAGLVIGCGGAQLVTPMPGGACSTENTATCEKGNGRLLDCLDGGWVELSDCHGPNGCSETSTTVSCDTSGNTVGDLCAPSSEGKVRCDPDGGAFILRCERSTLTAIFTCPQGTRCGISDAGLSCY